MEKTPNTPNTPNTPKPSESNNLGSGHQTASTKLGGSRLKVMHKTMEDFKICRNHDVVEKDIRFLKERKKDFTPKGKEADGFERITSNGMITDRWLGNIPNKRGLVPFRVENVFMAKNSDETPYDDVVNKIDYTVSLDIPNRQDPIFIGFDVTLDINALEDKLLRTTTDPDKKVPFGFSGLDYCYTREGQMLPQISNVPRYCLTMDLNEEKLDRYNHDWFLLRFPPKDKKGEQYEDAKKYISNFNARTRFMVLSEIYEQNKLYKAMLPPLNGKDNLTIKDAESKLDAIVPAVRRGP